MTKAKDQRSQSMKEQAYNVDRDKDHKSLTTKAISLISKEGHSETTIGGRLVASILLMLEPMEFVTMVPDRTSTLGSVLSKCLGGGDNRGFDLKGYSDSDYAGCNMDRKSTSGAYQYLVENWDHILKEAIELYFIPTEYQLADIFTKPLDEPTFTSLKAKLGMLNIDKSVSQINHV
ncbi:hypothetical protein Tco_1132139 [Tanacetum coccineum]|uniref:Uncharacterized protein n=1 Tax=Tanacetum coccineum TaxID=301880 RepID=A0ABQ5JB57_9ASTR